MNKIPSLGSTVNAVLDAFKKLDTEWGSMGYVEARDIFGLTYRWLPAINGGHLGVSENEGFTLRRATDAEYTALEKAISAGQVQIVQFFRMKRELTVHHQSTGKPMPMGGDDA